MSETNVFDQMLCMSSKNADEIICMERISSKQSLRVKCDAKFLDEGNADKEFSRPTGNWCEGLSSSLNNANAKLAWKNGTGKLSQTLNNVRNTFGFISQRIKKSIKKRQSLVSMKSPRSPITPYTRSRAVLGRTPTKLYSPFSIDTPAGKENYSNRFVKDGNHLISQSTRNGKKKLWKTRLDLGDFDGEKSKNMADAVLSNNLLQTQIEIYELQSIVKRISQSGTKYAKRF